MPNLWGDKIHLSTRDLSTNPFSVFLLIPSRKATKQQDVFSHDSETNVHIMQTQEKTSLNFKAGYHVIYTFNAPKHMAVVAEHQFAMFGAMYSLCL